MYALRRRAVLVAWRLVFVLACFSQTHLLSSRLLAFGVCFAPSLPDSTSDFHYLDKPSTWILSAHKPFNLSIYQHGQSFSSFSRSEERLYAQPYKQR